MARGKSEYLNEIFRLLSEQRGLLKHLPYSSEQVRKEKENFSPHPQTGRSDHLFRAIDGKWSEVSRAQF
jgi:hypothetical protein